jgi:hypothetical protein
MGRGWVAFTVFAVLATLGLAACGSGETKTVTVTTGEEAAATESTESTEPSDSASSGSAPEVQTFNGTGPKRLGTITVPSNATVSWECASCGGSGEKLFSIENAESDPNSFSTFTYFHTHGVETVAEGVYHAVVVNSEAGPWTVKIEGE